MTIVGMTWLEVRELLSVRLLMEVSVEHCGCVTRMSRVTSAVGQQSGKHNINSFGIATCGQMTESPCFASIESLS
jgi:hypothetical protein